MLKSSLLKMEFGPQQGLFGVVLKYIMMYNVLFHISRINT